MSRLTDEVISQVTAWKGVESAPHRFGGTEFLLAGQEIGHVHDFGLADLVFSRPLRDALVAEGNALPHHIYPKSTFVSFYVEHEPDVEHAVWLFRVSFLLHWIVLRRHAERHPTLPTVDVADEMTRLKLSPALRTLFDDLLQGRAARHS